MEQGTSIDFTPQRSAEWFDVRRGKVTSSEVFKLLTEPRSAEAKKNGELSEGAKTYIKTKVAEVYGFVPDFENDAMVWGVEEERKAAYWYSKLTGNTVEECGFVQASTFYGGSPDGRVTEISTENFGQVISVGALEIKCPYNTTNHIDHCLLKTQDDLKKEHPNKYWQCVSHCIVLNVSWCDFVSFDPRIDKECGFYRLRITPTEEEKRLLLEKIAKAEAYYNEILTTLNLKK